MVEFIVIVGRQPLMSSDRSAADEPEPGEPLWREVLGERLRSLRHDRGETLGNTATRAGVSPQYLSEMERGLKEPSSEMIAAVAGALDVTLGELTLDVAQRLAQPQSGTSTRLSAGQSVLALAA